MRTEIDYIRTAQGAEDFGGSQWIFPNLIVIHLKDIGVSAVSHEVLHGVFDVARHIGVKLSLSSEEFYTYMMSYIMKEFYNHPRTKRFQNETTGVE